MRRTVDLPFNESNDRVETLKQIHFVGKNYFGELVITSERRNYLQTPESMSSTTTYCYLPTRDFCPDNQLSLRMSHQYHLALSVILY
jgi:hypothetical protein